MRKRRFALSALLIMCMAVAMILTVMPMSILAADAAAPALTGTKLTTAHAGQTLAAGEYYVEPGATLTLRGGTGKSGLTVAANSTVTIHIPANSTLNVYGGAASGTTGAGAGIEVVSGSNLKVIGSGTLNAYGGKAANGSNGAKGDNADWVDDGKSYIPDSGYGGAGGGGAGAGIGTKGGKGGSNTSWRTGFLSRSQKTDNFMKINYSGSHGYDGNNGESAAECGGIFVQPGVTVNAVGGAAGTSGGSGGAAGSRDYESDDSWMHGLAGGSGGGGGGAGKKGASVGTGGGGGGSGGSGGAIGHVWSYRFLGAGGGGGGAGAVGGSGGAWSSDGEIPDCKEKEHFGGVERYSGSGASGGKDNGGNGGSGAKVKIKDWSETYWQWPYAGNGGKGGNAGSDCSEKGYQALYTVSIDNGESTTVYYASSDKFLPATLAVQNQTGYTFKGYYGANDTQYYDENGNRITSAKVTDNMTIFAKFDVNEYDYKIDRNPDSSGNLGAETEGTAEYGSSITLTTPNRDGYLFRGWKISASNGTLNQDAYYTYSTAAPVMRMATRSSDQSSNQSFAREGASFLTAGFETIGSSVTLYNLSAEDGAEITIEEMWVRDSFEVTFKDFDGTVIGTQSGKFVDVITAPAIPNNTSEYYTYTFKYWKCNIDGSKYQATEALPNMGAFLSYESELGEAVYTGITFTAVYDIEYKKELHFVGSLGNTAGNDNFVTDDPEFPNGVLVLGEGSTNVPVITNFKITQNDGVATLLLIPKYDANVFTIQEIYINGQKVYYGGASVEPTADSTTTELLNGFKVTVTGNESPADMLKILLDNDNQTISSDNSVSDKDIFVQIVYEMKTAIGGSYEFGFVTADYENVCTDQITHGDRSEAYGTYDPDVNTDTDAWRFNELKITVDTAAINVVIRVNGKIEISDNQIFIYNGQQMSAADVTEQIKDVLQYTYNGFAQKKNDTITIKWYDMEGNELSEAPKNVGTYQIGISAAQTTYYFAADEVRATFTITPYEIFVVAGDQTFEYTGSNIVINGAASQGGIFVKDADGNYIPVDAFVNSDLTFSRVTLLDNYADVGVYKAIQGIVVGDASNYTVTNVIGTLTITKAVNGWNGEIIAPGGEYNGQKFDQVTFDAKFGADNAKIEYFYGYDENKNEILKTEAPENAGTYIVRITIPETDNYSGLVGEVTLIITKKAFNVSGLNFTAIDKIYNGNSQYWSINPDGIKETDDAEVRLIVSDESLLQNIIFAGMKHPTECMHVGTYEILAILQISNPNYTFIETYVEKDENGQDVEKTREVDEYEFAVEVKILPRKINVDMIDQEKTYDGTEPQVQQGQGYVTINPADVAAGSAEFEALLAIIERDFFGGERDIYMSAMEYSSTAAYYYLDGYGNYVPITLTQDEFNANKELSGEAGYKDIYTKITIQPETIQLYKDSGFDAGTYALHALLGNNSNYEIVSESGNFIILKQTLELPTLGSVTYNGEQQTHSVADTDLYTLEHNMYIDAGVYKVLVSLRDHVNYQWEIDGAQETSDDQHVVWYINPKEITVILPDAAQEYTYGDTYGQIQWNGSYTWNGDAPYDRDGIQIEYGFNVDQNWVFDAGMYNAVVLEVTGAGKDNYIVNYEGGLLTVNKKAITKDELAAHIKSAIKYYTGDAISWVIDDFTIDNSYATIIALKSVGTTGYKNANGIYENDAFTYHPSGTQYFADVEIRVLSSNYKLADDITDDTVEIEVFIAKAYNSWDVAPSIDASKLDQIVINADPKFGTESDVTVTYFEDEDCKQPIGVSEMVAGETYFAVFTVAGTDNYFELSDVIHFNSKVVTVKIPVVYLENGTIKAGVEYKKPYIGTKYRFDCNDNAMNSSLYTYTFSGDPGLTNAGTYTITFTLIGENGQYEWEDGSTGSVVFTLIIERANLTIKPDDFTITYKDDAPAYTLDATGLVNGETLEELLSDELYAELTQFNCAYLNGSNAGTYNIFACNNDSATQAEIVDALKNYNVTFENGILTVTALTVDYDDVDSSDDKTLQDLINNGPGFVYDSESKEVKVENLPDELEVVIVYKDKDGNVLPEGQKPENAGEYTVEIKLQVKDPEKAGNYDLPDEVARITLTINKAEITITVYDKTYDYNGTNRYDQFTLDVENGIDAYYEVTFDNVSVFDDGSKVTSIVLTQGDYVDAGAYADKITAVHTYSADNYVVTIVKGDLIITKATNEWTTPLASGDNIVYDKDAVVDGVDFWSEAKFGDASVVYKFYLKQANGTYVEISAPTNAGTYYVQATVSETSNYEGLDSGLVMLVINKDTITIGAVTFDHGEVYYNGQAQYILAGNYDELFNVSYTGNGKINAGTYTVTATFTIKDTANYELEGADSKSATLTINKVQITITADDKTSMFGDAIENLTYDIVFTGDPDYIDFYENNWGSIVLSTTATILSDVGTYEIDSETISNTVNYEVTFHKGTYTITKFTGNKITVKAEDVRYLMDLIYSAEALRGQSTIQFTFATSEDGEYTETQPKNVGTYYVKATIADTDNYEGCVSDPVSFKIGQATLSAITNITYNKDTATWTAVGTTTDGIEIDCTVSYHVGELILNTTSFTATSKGNFSVIAVPSGTTASNYNSSAAVTLAEVYEVIFADNVENHAKQPNEADLTASAFATQYRFAGQAATRPDAIPTVEGYTFREWVIGSSDYNFASGVNSNITLYADWTVIKYTVTFYNDATEDRIENGVFVPGAPDYVVYYVIEVEYGESIHLPAAPTKTDDVFIYTFSHWSESQGGAEIADLVVKGDLALYAVYDWKTGAVTITYMISADGASYEQYKTVIVTTEDVLEMLADKPWFIEDGWYIDAERTIRIESLPVVNITLYGAYIFDIGAGDVNADGEIDVDDITLYRRWIVGGYNIVSVAPGSEWNLVNSDSFDANTLYFVERVSDANRDDSGDIRDITTVRMALTGKYGYTYVSGRDSAAGVTGFGVVFVLDTVPGISDADSLMSAINDASSDEVYIKLMGDIVMDTTLRLENGEKITIHLNGHTLTMANVASNYAAAVKNGTLTIEGEGTVIVPGMFGFGTASDTTTGHIVINGGNFVGEQAEYLFSCYNGSITINDGNFTANYCVLNNFYYDENGNTMTGTVTVRGGTFEVTGEMSYAILVGEYAEINIEGEPVYVIHEAGNLFSAVAYGGKAVLYEDVVLTQDSYATDVYANAIIDLNGHNMTLSDSVTVLEGVTLTIEGEGEVSANGDCVFMTEIGAQIVVNGGTFADNIFQDGCNVADNRE